jgi:hypothetical protein
MVLRGLNGQDVKDEWPMLQRRQHIAQQRRAARLLAVQHVRQRDGFDRHASETVVLLEALDVTGGELRNRQHKLKGCQAVAQRQPKIVGEVLVAILGMRQGNQIVDIHAGDDPRAP